MKYTRQNILWANRIVKSILICSIFFLLSIQSKAQLIGNLSYDKNLYNALFKDKNSDKDKYDEVEVALQVISNSASDIYAGEVAAQLRKDFPAYDPNVSIRLQSYVIQNRITKGEDYERMNRVIKPLLRFMGLEERVLPVLFRSDVPVVGFSFPNALMFSTTALQILNDEELDALASHEVSHFASYKAYKTAMEKHDNRALRAVELFCDASAISIMTSRSNTRDPRNLIKGLYKMLDVLKTTTGDDDRKGDHPTMDQRVQLNTTLLKRFEEGLAKAIKKD